MTESSYNDETWHFIYAGINRPLIFKDYIQHQEGNTFKFITRVSQILVTKNLGMVKINLN